MHRIIKTHFSSFVKSHGLEAESEAGQFEKFANYSILSSKLGARFDLDDVTTGDGDDGTDGLAIIIDEEIILSPEDAASVFATNKRNHDVETFFIQTKRSESFDLGDFLKFKESILRFVNSDIYQSNDDVQQSAHEVFDLSLSNVPKIRNGKPSVTARYVTTGVYENPEAIESAKNEFEKQLKELGLFSSIDIKFVGRDELTSLWVATYSGTSAIIEMFSHASLPTILDIDEAYLAVVKAKDIVKNLLITEDGNLKTQVFEENVRSFLGLENQVNSSIEETINKGDAATRFPVLNNGITIVSPDVRVQGNLLHLVDYQIVNGCQTSNVLYENRDHLDDSIMVTVKVVETSNEDVFSELVRATNSQTKVDETQFLSLRPIVKKVEQFFNTYEGQESRLFFERRDRQYVGHDIPAIRIFSVHDAAKCVSAMFCKRPDLSFRYPKRMYEELTETIFSEDVREIIFYTACLTLYRLHLLVSNRTIPQNMKRFKWHILALVCFIITGKQPPKFNSRKIESYCQSIVDIFSHYGDELIKPFKEAVGVIQSLGDITNDRLKRQLVLQEMLKKISN